MWLTKTLFVLHSHALCVYFYSSALMWLKTPTASQNIFNCVLFFCIKLWTFVKQPEEGSPAAHWESSSWPEVHQLSLLLANRRVSCAILLIVPLLTSEHWGQIPFRWHANYVPMAAQFGVWKDAWRCWQRAAGSLPASITRLLSPFSPLFSSSNLSSRVPICLKKKTPYFTFPQRSPILCFPSSHSLHHMFLCF